MNTANLLRDPEALLTSAQLAGICGVTRGTIEYWRARGIDLPPKITLTARCIRYRAGDVSAWLHRRRSAGDATSEGRAA